MSEAKLKPKCNAAKNHWCKPIIEFAQFNNVSSKGLCRTHMFRRTRNMKTDEDYCQTGYALTYRPQNGSRKPYVWLNFCPFCGSDVSNGIAKNARKKGVRTI